VANLSKQSDYERERNQRLQEEVRRHEHAESTDRILAEEALKGIVVWSKEMEHYVETEHRPNAYHYD